MLSVSKVAAFNLIFDFSMTVLHDIKISLCLIS